MRQSFSVGSFISERRTVEGGCILSYNYKVPVTAATRQLKSTLLDQCYLSH